MSKPRSSRNDVSVTTDTRRSLTRWAVLAGFVALLWVAFGASPAFAGPAPNPSGNLDQCENGQIATPEQCTGDNWVNGNLGKNNSNYREGDSVPFRILLEGLATSGSHELVIEYDTLHSGKHAYDYLTSYDRTETDAEPCSGISPCANPSSFPIPSAGLSIAQAPGSFTIWNGTITDVEYGAASGDQQSVIITFEADDPTVLIAWGGHIASQFDWGVGMSAGAIPGSPYHMRFLELDGSGGNQDRSLSSDSIAPIPPTFNTQVSDDSFTLPGSVTDLATISSPSGAVNGTVAFFVCGPELVSNPNCDSGGVQVGSAVTLSSGSATSASYSPSQPGKYCFRAEYAPDLFAPFSAARHTNLTTECFEATIALGTLRVIKNVVNDDDGTKVASDFSLHVKSGGNDVASSPQPGSATGTVYTLATGSYTVSEDAPPAGYAASFSGDCDSTGAVTVVAGVERTCTITNNDSDVPSSIEVTKSANPTSLAEPGGNATFSVTVQNTSAVDPVTISTLSDDVYGNLDGKGDCDVPQLLAPGASYSCSFSGAVSGNAGSSHTDVVTASGTDDDGSPVSDDDDATVTITNLPSSILVTKSANPTSLPEPGGNATFSVTVQNTSVADSVTISSLSDNVYGNLDGQGTCDVSPAVVLAPNASYSCSFTGAVTGNAGSSHTDVVTASGTDDDGSPVSDDDDATVTITNLPSSILVTKSANPTSLAEPGGNATFSVTVQNTSAADSVTISSLTDNVYGDLDGKGDCDVPKLLAPGASFSCSFTGAVSGNAGSSHTDVVTASGTDDDGNPVSDDDDATVTITGLPSSIQVTKSANPISLPESGGNVTFSVTVQNTSAVDTVTISSLTDNVYGDLNGKGDCAVPQQLAPGASFSCSFTGAVSGNAGSSHTDVVTASGTDDDGNPVSDNDDATVALTDTPSSIVVMKSASPTSLAEPGGNATFSVSVQNTSAVDSVTISSLSDDVYGNLNGKGDCDVSPAVVLAPNASYGCSFTGAVSGNAGSTHTDVVTASGTDDDGNPVSDTDDATVTITNTASSIEATKSASPTSLAEPGGNATFSVSVQNTSAVDSVTISSLSDDVYGDLDGKGTCDVSPAVSLAPNASYSCSFTGAVSGNAGSSHTDVVTASGTDDDGNPVSDTDDATVTLTNLPSSIVVTKSADPNTLPEPGGNSTFSVTVQNTSAVDSVTITSLSDNVYGDLNGKGDCVAPQTLLPSATYSCSFTGAVSGGAGSAHTDTVTASGTDDDQNPVSGSDDAVVTITNLPSSIKVTKSASPTSIQEPGGNATFSVTVQNLSAVDSVVITSLSDNVYGNLDGKGTCAVPQQLAPGASFSCSFTGAVSGSGGSSHTDVVTASGFDDDETPVTANDDATVAITSAPPPPAPPAPPVVVVAPAPPPMIDLSIAKTDRPDPVFVGSLLTYTLSVRNLGPDTATNVRVMDALPGAVSFVSVTSSQGTCSGGRVVSCSLGTIASGGRATVTIVVRANEAGAVLNTATVVGNEAETNTANNQASAPTLVRGVFQPPAVVTCPTFTATPRSLSVGRKGVIRVVVTSRGKGVKGVRVQVRGPGLLKSAVTGARGRVTITVRPKRTGIVQIRMMNQPGTCGTRRIGVVGVFQPPPVTG